MDYGRQSLKRVVFKSRGASSSDFYHTVILSVSVALGIAVFSSDYANAHYPFPSSQEERAKAKQIDQAREQSDQQGVDVLIGFLSDQNLRVRTATFLSLIYLSPSGFEMERAVVIANQQGRQEQQRISPYVNAAAEVFLVLQNPALSNDQKQNKLIELSSAEDGALRRMAVEGLQAYGDTRCLPALARRVNDPFGDHDDIYDMRAVSRIAFEVWWKIRSTNLDSEQQISTIIASLEAARPFGSRWGDAACDILEGMGYGPVRQLIEVYSGKACNSRAWAARTLRKPELRGADRKRVRQIAIGDLRGKDQTYYWTAAYLLERFAEKEDLDLFVEMLASHREPSMRDFAARRLGEFGGAKAIAALKGALADEQMQTRVLAAATLAALGQKDGHKLLLESFANLDLARNISLGAIQYLDQDQVCARMLELLKSIETFESDDERQRFLFRYARADLLRYLDKMPAHKLEPAIPTLKSLLKYPDDSISRRSATLLKKLGVALKWKYDIGQKRGWYEVMPAGGGKQAGKAPPAPAKKSPVILSLAELRTAQDELNAARQLSRKYWAIRENSPHDSQHALASFEKAVSAFRAVSEKYAGTDIDAQAHIGLFKLFHLAEDEKRSGEIVDELSAGFGADRVSDAYSELGLDYLQRAHDPRRALAVFAKIPMPPAPDANDKSPKALHNYELVRHTYAKVQQPMAKCEVQLGELGKAEKRYARLIELFPELAESFQRSLESEVERIATQRLRNKYWLSLTALKQKLHQRRAARWLEDSQRRREQAEQQRWGKEVNGLQCSIGIEPAELRVGDSLVIKVEIKNVSAGDICLHYQNLYQAGKLTVKNERGETVASMQTARYDWPHPKEFFHIVKAGQTFTEQMKGRVEIKFIRAQEAGDNVTAHPLQIDFGDFAQQIEQPGRFTAVLQLTADEKTVSMGTQFGFTQIWTGKLISKEIEFGVRRMRRDELDAMIAQLRTGSDEEKTEAIEVIKANKDRQAVRELMSLLTSRKGPLRAVSNALVRIQDLSILGDLLDLYRISARYGTTGRGEFQSTLLQTIRSLEPDQQKLDALFIEVIKSEALVDARQYAASYLGSRDYPQVVAALFEAAGKEPPQVQWAAIDSLGRIGSQRKIGDKKSIIEPLAEILKTAPNSKVRRRAASALGQVGSNLVVPSLIEALEDEDLFVGASASHYLGRYAGPEAVVPLERYISRAETDSQKRAAGDAIKFIRQRAASKCARSFSGELCGSTFYVPVFVPQIAGIYTGQGHYRFGIVFVPSHSSTFEPFGQTATKRLRRSRTYVIAKLEERGIIRHWNTLGHIFT